MSVTFISYRPGDADYTTHTLHALEGASQSGQTQVVELITIGGVTYAMVIDANTAATNGLNGWTPVLAAHVDGDRTLLRVSDWTGGGGTKPATGLFIGASGFVADMAQAVSVRGAKGDAGDLAALADGSIAKAKLSTGVQASLAKADSSVQDLVGMTTKATAGTAEQKTAHRDALGLGPIATMTLTEAQSAVSGDAPPWYFGISKRGGKFIPWGDSTSHQNAQNTTATTVALLGNAFVQIGVRMAGNPVDVVQVSGNSGQRTDQIIPLFSTQVAAYSPDYVMLCVPTNDLLQGYGPTYALNGVATMAALVESIGAVPIVMTVCAGESFASNATLRADWLAYNTAIRAVAKAKGWPLVDGMNAYLDPASPTYAPLPGYTDGQVHPINKGALALGRVLADVLLKLPRRNLHNPLQVSTNLAANPNNTGTDGTKPTGVTGSVPTGGTYTIGGGAAAVSSIVARDDGGPGSWWQTDATIPAGGYCSAMPASNSLASIGAAVGDIVRLVADIEVLPGFSGIYGVDLRLRFFGSSGIQYAQSYTPATALGDLVPGKFKAQLRVPEIPIPAGTTSLSLYVIPIVSSGAATCSFRVGGISGRKV